jgi:hypothetical protein
MLLNSTLLLSIFPWTVLIKYGLRIQDIKKSLRIKELTDLSVPLETAIRVEVSGKCFQSFSGIGAWKLQVHSLLTQQITISYYAGCNALKSHLGRQNVLSMSFHLLVCPELHWNYGGPTEIKAIPLVSSFTKSTANDRGLEVIEMKSSNSDFV